MNNTDIPVAVGHIPSGLFIVAVDHNGQKDGYLASWVQQVSFKPLLVSFTIKSDRPGYEAIKSGSVFTINIVGEHESQYLRHFWSGYAPGQSPFNQIEHTTTSNGGLVINGAKSAIDCKFVSISKPGDHEVVVAEVIGSTINNQEAKPKVHIRKSGLDY
ncbi:MAG: hypothetical protein COW00_15765 [Bdellovibrio sp. CG12_big_fil_rev_8_21_14_0_65_39_13]|nr:MAG: hypothetical protein COW78_05630 [Bdellovibrio sp. CG22_combo_CG10-13_8_21_14_all_39_27]PIQ58456.1 MAG: hypothetical protein COW00_15765 [Bdellovibrio sp. CG12_big_fil_rev_8_21_14_0_65_39_13]PIR35409.1 MAG: hypothetical protein COV37_07980 [Bdellovibrio sp. CG11_big_fil_rev_8_21_14_0_20_39_38]PJB52868.1 MAG: hypothetical protein CO099_10305 [Bdellovibrio sp. CG_4_9_14_3_um_filter_39_7]